MDKSHDHTSLKSFLENEYGIVVGEEPLLIVIDYGKPIEVRKPPAYDAFIKQFVENRFEPVTPSPFKRPEVIIKQLSSLPNENEESPPW
jgi:hypothetical protein